MSEMVQVEIKSPLAIALGNAQNEFPIVVKDKTVKKKGKSKAGNEFEYSYKYADLSNVIESIRHVLFKHGLAFTQLPMLSEERFTLLTKIIHCSGEELVSHWPLSMMQDPQDMGAQLTYVKRYALCAALGIAADEDVDGKIKEADKGGKRSAPTAPGKGYGLVDDLGEFTTHGSATAFLDALEALLKVSDDPRALLESNLTPFEAIQAKANKAKMEAIVGRCAAIYKDATTEPATLNP